MIECTQFKRFQKGSLQGFASIYVEKWDMDIPGFKLFMKDGRKWVNLPDRRYEDNGEEKFAPLFRFREKDNEDLFKEQVRKAISDYCAAHPYPDTPEVLPDLPAPEDLPF